MKCDICNGTTWRKAGVIIQNKFKKFQRCQCKTCGAYRKGKQIRSPQH